MGLLGIHQRAESRLGGGVGPERLHMAVGSKAERESNHMFRIYKTIIELLRLLASVFVKIAQHDADLARQARRAASSIALNCGEAAGVRGGNRRLRLLTALGSAREVEAACDVAEALGYVTLNAETRRVLSHVIGALVQLTR